MLALLVGGIFSLVGVFQYYVGFVFSIVLFFLSIESLKSAPTAFGIMLPAIIIGFAIDITLNITLKVYYDYFVFAVFFFFGGALILDIFSDYYQKRQKDSLL